MRPVNEKYNFQTYKMTNLFHNPLHKSNLTCQTYLPIQDTLQQETDKPDIYYKYVLKDILNKLKEKCKVTYRHMSPFHVGAFVNLKYCGYVLQKHSFTEVFTRLLV